MTTEEYISRTRPIVNFLTHVFDEHVVMTAAIIKAQADQDTERLIEMLGLIKGHVEDWIEYLKKI